MGKSYFYVYIREYLSVQAPIALRVIGLEEVV